MNYISFHLKNTGKEQTQTKENRNKEILKLRSEINEIRNKYKTESIKKLNLIY